MRNMLIALAVAATVVIAGAAIAAPPTSSDARSVLTQSPSDVQTRAMRQATVHPRTMVVSQMAQPVIQQNQVVNQQRRSYYRSQAQKKQSFFDKLIDAERRKNSWLKGTFLGF